ncbi:MAG: DASS family sodium-coupled anion symporter [Bryobacterales bacterium]|nr:DASS family sodium-coupled anion symporter [Bryobacterales bacterium]
MTETKANHVAEPSRSAAPPPRTEKYLKIAAILAVYLLVIFAVPRPAGATEDGWRLLAIFLATVTGLVLQPIAGGALVLLGVTMTAALGTLTAAQALAGYADPSVWLVVAAFIISRALINSGLARRIALFFVRLFGQSSLGVCYSLCVSDAVLAAIVPSNGARSGGVILPIARSICELYGSTPGKTAALLGTFLITGVYQGVCITAAMFYTGQAGNPLAASIATKAGFEITPKTWFLAGIVPGLCSLLIIPLVVFWMLKPGITRTPEAAAFANRELLAMGPLKNAERIVGAVFLTVCFGWVTFKWLHNVDITTVGLAGCGVLLLSGVITWEDVKRETGLWDLYIWYGGVVMMGRALNDKGVTEAFAKSVAATFSEAGWVTLFIIALLVYFYAHYTLASITAHILAMYPPFLAVLIAKGAPIGLVAFAFATFVNFAAGLTHYGTTPSPMFFAQDYVTMRQWWKIGFVVSVLNLAIWSSVGFAWWKAIGIW